MKPSIETNFAAFIGIDWADAKHDVCVQQAGSDQRERSVLVHRPEAIEHWALSLRERFAGRPIAVCLEIAKGPLVHALQRYPFLVLFPVNPTTLAKYRETFCVSGAKDDPSDAELPSSSSSCIRRSSMPCGRKAPPCAPWSNWSSSGACWLTRCAASPTG
jgi:Transposase